MAIKLASTLVKEFSYISLHDEAIDASGDDFEEEFKKYREGQIPLPPLKDGVEPTVWTLKPITSARLSAMLDGVRAEHGQAAWTVATAAAGIKGVSGLKNADGTAFKLTPFQRVDGYEILTNEVLDAIGPAVLNELGMAILTHNSPS
jgi:hypothetical protein